MKKFIFKRRKFGDETVLESLRPRSLVQENIQPTSPTSTDTVRKYLDSYFNFGFTFTGSKNRFVPQWVVRGEKFSNQFMDHNKSKRYLNTKQNHLSRKNTIYFSRLLVS